MHEILPLFAVTPQTFTQELSRENEKDYALAFGKRFIESDSPGAIIWNAESEEENGFSLFKFILNAADTEDKYFNRELEKYLVTDHDVFRTKFQKIHGSPKIKSFESETCFIEEALGIISQPDSFLDGIIISEEYKAAIAEFDPQGLEDQTESSPDENPGLEEGDAESVQEVASEDTDAHPEGSSFEKDGENGDSATAQEVPEVEPEPDRCEINSEGVEAENKPLEESDEE